MDKKEYTVNELCQRYNISRVTVDRYRERGLPFIRKGRNIYFILKDVEEWMENNFGAKRYNYENKENTN